MEGEVRLEPLSRRLIVSGSRKKRGGGGEKEGRTGREVTGGVLSLLSVPARAVEFRGGGEKYGIKKRGRG